MKIRKAIKMAVTGAALTAPMMMVMVGDAMATAHTGALPSSMFGNWSVDTSADQLNVDCPTGYTCATASVTDTGFMQRTITKVGGAQDGSEYVQTIISDVSNTTGDSFGNQTGNTFFGDENFIKMNGLGGLSGQSMLKDATGSQGVFTAQTNLNAGDEFMTMQNTSDAGSMGDGSMVELQQGIVDTANEFQSRFQFDHGMAMDGAMGSKFAVIGIDDFANDTANGFTSGFQFQNKVVEGDTALAATFDAKLQDITMMLDPADITQEFSVKTREGAATGNGASQFSSAPTVTFTAGDSIYQMDLGQSVTGAGDFGITEFKNGGSSGKEQSLTSAAIPFNTITDDLGVTTDAFEAFDPFAP